MSIINAIVSAIMSFLMLLFPWMQPSDPVEPPVEPETTVNIVICENDENLAFGDGKPHIFSDYAAWNDYISGTKVQPGSYKIGIDPYNETFFKENSLVVIEVYEAADLDIEVASAEEEGNILKVTYGITDCQSGFMLEGYKLILVTVGKNITDVDATVSFDKRSGTMLDYDGKRTKSLGADSKWNGHPNAVYSSYAEWKASPVTVEWYTEKFFETKSLAVIIIKIPNTGTGNPHNTGSIDVIGSYEENNTVNVEYSVTPRGSALAECYEALIIPVSKNVTNVSAAELGAVQPA